MSAAIAEAAVNEALELSWLFRQNAALRHGLPDAKRTGGVRSIDDQKPPVVNITNNIPPPATTPAATNTATPEVSWIKKAAPYVLAATGAAGATLGAGYWLLDRDHPQPVQQVPADGSLLEYLQQRGAHLPEGWPQ